MTLENIVYACYEEHKKHTSNWQHGKPQKAYYDLEGGEQFTPYLFGKGDWQDVSRLRLEVNYDDIKGKTFKTVCEYNDKKESGESETDQPLPRTGTEG